MRTKQQLQYIFYLCFSVLLHIFFTSNSVVFVDGGRKDISCHRVP